MCTMCSSKCCKVRKMLFYFYKFKIKNCGKNKAVNVTKVQYKGKFVILLQVCVHLVNSKFLPCHTICEMRLSQ